MLDILSILLLICIILLIVFFNPINLKEGLDNSCETKLAAAQAPVLKGQTPQGMINTAAIANLTKQLQGFSSIRQDIANLKVITTKQQEALQKIGQLIQNQGYGAANTDADSAPKPLPTISGLN